MRQRTRPMSHRLHRVLVGVGLVWLHGCTVPTEDVSSARGRLDQPGPWAIADATLARGDAQFVPYAGAGPWNGGADCAGGLSSGAAIVRAYLLEHFPQTRVIGGYACRQNTANTAQMSIHAVGRALDIMLPKSNGSADNDLGDPIGAWLIENAETIGIQYIIWDEWTWSASRSVGTKGRTYTGPNPHHDHLHVELGADAGARTTDWFSGLVTPPTKEGCVALGPRGGVVDEVEQEGGDPRSLGPAREVEDLVVGRVPPVDGALADHGGDAQHPEREEHPGQGAGALLDLLADLRADLRTALPAARRGVVRHL